MKLDYYTPGVRYTRTTGKRPFDLKSRPTRTRPMGNNPSCNRVHPLQSVTTKKTPPPTKQKVVQFCAKRDKNQLDAVFVHYVSEKYDEMYQKRECYMSVREMYDFMRKNFDRRNVASTSGDESKTEG